MDPFPHIYTASASGAQSGTVLVSAAGLPELTSAPAPQFGGPGTLWSPEAMLAASIADCFIMTFRAVSGAALFRWIRLECRVDGILTRLKRQTQFTDFALHAALTIAPGTDAAKAQRLLRQTERSCLIINSLKGGHTLRTSVLSGSVGDNGTASGIA